MILKISGPYKLLKVILWLLPQACNPHQWNRPILFAGLLRLLPLICWISVTGATHAINSNKPLFRQPWSRSRVDRLIEIGLFPHISRGLLTKTIDEIGRFCALDSFESGGMHARGYCEFEPPVFIGIANLFNDPSTFTGVGLQIKRTTMHEDVHAIGAITNRGFTDYQAEQNADAVALGDWTDEVFASHAVQVSDSATPDPEI